MFPWQLEHTLHILFGSTTIGRLEQLIVSARGDAPDPETLDALLSQNPSVRRSTFEKRGLGGLHDFVTSEDARSIFESWDGRYRSFFSSIDLLCTKYSDLDDPDLKKGTAFMRCLLDALCYTRRTVEVIEAYVFGQLPQPMPDLPHKLPKPIFLKEVKSWPSEKKALAFELTSILYCLSALQVDLDACRPRMTIELADLVPKSLHGKRVYPLKRYFTWLRDEAGCRTWKELGALGNISEQAAKNAANAPIDKRSKKQKSEAKSVRSVDGALSWVDFGRIIDGLEESSEEWSDFRIDAYIGYALARLMQEHTFRSYDLVIKHFCEPDEIESYYMNCINECKKWVQTTHSLHPC